MFTAATVGVARRTASRWLQSARLPLHQNFGVGSSRRVRVSESVSLPMAALETLAFDNRALKSLPIDEEERNFVRTVPGTT